MNDQQQYSGYPRLRQSSGQQCPSGDSGKGSGVAFYAPASDGLIYMQKILWLIGKKIARASCV